MMIWLKWTGVGVAIAAIAWLPLEVDAQLSALWFLPIAWLLAPNKQSAFALIFAYYLFTGREGGEIIHRFGEMHIFQAYGVIAICSASVALLWALAWQSKPQWRIGGLIGILVATSLPPLGGFIYGSPLLTAGWLFPGAGFVGIALLVMSWVSVFAFIESKKHQEQIAKYIATTGLLLCAGASLMLNSRYDTPTIKSVHAVNTQFARFPKPLDAQYERHEQLIKTAKDALKQPYPIVLMPEEVGGLWQPRFAWMWEEVGQAYAEQNKTLVVGFDTKPDGKFANTAKILGVAAKSKPVDIVARVSAPIGAWRPWDDKLHAPARWAIPAHTELLNQPYIFIFCWEELVPWPWLSSAVSLSQAADKHAPTVLVMANNWFGKDLAINDAQKRSSQAWARLLGWGGVRAVNAP